MNLTQTAIMKIKYFHFAFLFCVASTGFSQKEFFKSPVEFSEDELENFYSSITISNDKVLFNGSDYYLYAFNKNSGELLWQTELNYKTDIPVFVDDTIVYAGSSKREQQLAVQLSLNSGKLIRELPFGPLQTKPFIKNGQLYGTAIHDYGCIISYDIKKDTVTWSRFIAHGISRQPYFLESKILANAEADNWVELGYNGALLDTTCTEKAEVFMEGIPCVKKHIGLSHDDREITGKVATAIFGEDYMENPDIITSGNFTYILNEDKLIVLSGKLKKVHEVSIGSLMKEEGASTTAQRLIKADDQNVWVLSHDHLLQYNHKTKKVINVAHLEAYQPHQLLMDDGKLWIISRKDGRLYGISN